MTKTVLIYDQCGQAAIEFYVVDGDLTHLEGVFINSSEGKRKLQNELSNLMYDKKGQPKLKPCKRFPYKTVKAGAPVIVCGFLP